MRTKLLLITLSLLLTSQLATAGNESKRADHRQQRQAERINNGWENGSLTRRETTTLAAQQAHIRRTEKRFEADGQLSNKEKARLEIKQDRASRNIYRKKHNQRSRG